jgi:hypothetical protein
MVIIIETKILNSKSNVDDFTVCMVIIDKLLDI